MQDLITKLEAEATKRQVAQEVLQDLNTKLAYEVEMRQAAQEAFQELNNKLTDEAKRQQIDSLTGAFTRRRLLELGEYEISRSRRLNHSFSVLMFDIDFFKRINDTYGHAAGDKVLTSVVQAVNKQIRQIDFLGRLGGDEFVVIFPETGIKDANVVAERSRKIIEDHLIEWEDKKIFVQASFGIIEWSGQDANVSELLKRVDDNLYKAKRDGRSRVIGALDGDAIERQATQEALQDLNTKLEAEVVERQAAQEALQDLNTKLEAEAIERQAAQVELQQLNLDLEDIVAKRTCELQNINASLEEEIMEREAAEELMRKQAEILDLAHDYILVSDIDSKIIYWNRGAQTGYGWLSSEAIGQVTHSLFKTQATMSVEHIMDRLQTNGRWEGERTHTRKDGSQIVVLSHLTLNRDAAGNPVTILEINHDITEQKKMEMGIARLDRLNTIGEMAASIGHEVRNPLTTVRGYLQHYGRKAAFAEYREPFKLMIEELDRANSIITEFLSLAKNKAVTMSFTDLNQIIQSLVPLLQSNALLKGNDIELDLGDIPEVWADDKEIRQCILNLVGNGLDASPKGSPITIGTAAAGSRVVLTVRDQGSGIPPEIKDKLGTPFLSTKEHGAGLGLAVCYRIAQRHEATIEIETGPKGTTMQFVFNQKGIS
ncbi:MAG: diguanylate cyclase [Anaerolineaceae bacterium]|nr:diguanylate cyclase [Anaerolineaceae bacterium]